MKFSRNKIILFFQYPLLIDWVSGWLLFNANSAIFQLCYGENKLIINEMMMRSALFWTNTLNWIFIVLAHWNNSPRVEMSLHSDTLFWFRANQSLLIVFRLLTYFVRLYNYEFWLSLCKIARSSVILLLPWFIIRNAAGLAEKQHILILLSLDWADRGSNPQSTTL